MSAKVTQIDTRLEERSIQTHRDLEALRDEFDDIQDMTVEHGNKLSALEERIKSLEKQSDRHWQVWLALGSTITALLVAFLKK